ncbi:MAG TPA: PAS domain-containing protein [Abditibacteriaceae bacterium]|jgi:PAS domain S-box-containing protein
MNNNLTDNALPVHASISAVESDSNPASAMFLTGQTLHDSARVPDSAPDYPHASETGEREAAIQRGRAHQQALATGQAVSSNHEIIAATNPALAALAENVRDYAIFLMNRDGVIEYWGEGARLIKWWTREQAEGAHLRLLYPEGGAEDGTAEEHLRKAAEVGEYVGEGQRVRCDGTTFWGHITLTALKDSQGNLLGFAKLTRDMTARRASEAAVALGNAAQSARDTAVAMAEEARAAQNRAEEAEAFAREHARGAQEYITRALEPELAARAEQSVETAQFARDVKESAHPPIEDKAHPSGNA